MTAYIIRLSDNLLEGMTLAAIEASCLGDGRKSQVETLGYIWGFKKNNGQNTIFYLDRMSLSISAKRTKNSVEANIRACRLKNEVVSRWSPQLTLLGDFHSHPYSDQKNVKECSGYEFSDEDFKDFLEDDLVWEQSGNMPVMLAITICKLSKVHETSAQIIKNNVWQYNVGDFRFWLNVAVGYEEGGQRTCTKNLRSKAFLDLHSRFLNLSGDRIVYD